MTIKHSNPTQQITPIDLQLLTKDESPYVNNLNRAPKNAYDYANAVNSIFSYGGSVSKVKVQHIGTVFNLYDIVHLSDGEVIEASTPLMNRNYRYGIVVSELDADNNYFICTFSPNFVFPSFISFAAPPGTLLYLGASGLTTVSNGVNLSIGNTPIAVVTGTNSIFFAGTARLFETASFI